MIPITDRQSRTIDIVTTIWQVATVGNKSIAYEISTYIITTSPYALIIIISVIQTALLHT